MSSSVRPEARAESVIPEPTSKARRHLTPTAKHVEVNVYDSRSVIGQSGGAAGAGEAQLLPVVRQRSVHPHVTGQGTVGQLPPKYHHVPLPLHGSVGVTGHLDTGNTPEVGGDSDELNLL